MKIGEITYQDSRRVYPVLDVYRDTSVGYGLAFEKLSGLPERAKSRLFNIDEIIERAVRGVYENVSEMFEENIFDRLMAQIVGEATFFQDQRAFATMHGRENKKYLGLHYSYHSAEIRRGSYIKVSGCHDLEKTILHEWGHEFLFQFCRLGISKYPYENLGLNKRYDAVMNEVFAILFERLAGRERYDNDPHMTADRLVTRMLKVQSGLERAGENIPFSDVVIYALNFNDHQDLAHKLSQLKKIKNPKGVLKRIRNSHRQE